MWFLGGRASFNAKIPSDWETAGLGGKNNGKLTTIFAIDQENVYH